MASKVPCFCFGSNSVTQLCERLQSDALVAEAATLHGWHRIFAGVSQKWGGGGVASLVEAAGSSCVGSIVQLTDEQFGRLDGFEGIQPGSDPECSDFSVNRYRRQWVVVAVPSVVAGGVEERRAIAYIRNSSEWGAFPSDAYLAACHRNISQFFEELDGPGSDGAGPCLVVRDGTGQVRGEWRPASAEPVVRQVL